MLLSIKRESDEELSVHRLIKWYLLDRTGQRPWKSYAKLTGREQEIERMILQTFVGSARPMLAQAAILKRVGEGAEAAGMVYLQQVVEEGPEAPQLVIPPRQPRKRRSARRPTQFD
jgi:hypothetical protein